ncbi:MAG: mechanosensitive ion channel [Clostridiaceae bacterium]|nr:mechanosensitive ion channel [Clostridiaceae bacterium]
MSYFSSIIDGIPRVISAVILLLIAFAVASIVKYLVVQALKKINAEKYTDKLGITDEKTGSSVEFLGKLAFLIVFVLFLTGVFEKLGMDRASASISSMVSQFVNYIPNIIAAVIILVIGIFVANLIRQVLNPLLKKLNVDKIQEKAGIGTSEGALISSVISNIVYVLILIPVIIASLHVLNIKAISEPALGMLNKIVLFLPNILVAVIILVIGAIIARIVGKLLTSILSGVGTDEIIKKAIGSDSPKLQNLSLSKVIGEAVRYIIVLLFVVEAANVLELEVLQLAGESVIAYLPLVISALIILVLALILTTWLENVILKNFPKAKAFAYAAKYTILAFAVLMMLNQLGVAAYIVNRAFLIILGSFAVAFALAFGLGGREFASNILSKAEKQIDKAITDKKEES